MTAPLPSAFRHDQESINAGAAAQRRSLRRFANRFPFVPAVVQAWNESSPKHSAWYGFNWGGSVTFILRDVPGFKTSEVIAAIEAVEQNFNIELDCTDHPERRSKTFNGAIKWKGGTFDIQLSVTLHDESPLCKRIQVGVETKVVQTPVYKLECAEGEEALA